MAKVIAIKGGVIKAEGLHAALNELVRIGDQLGEVIKMGEVSTIRLFGDAQAIGYGDRVEALGRQAGVYLGPYLAGAVLDGLGGLLGQNLYYRPNLEPPKGKGETTATRRKGDLVRRGEVIGQMDGFPIISPITGHVEEIYEGVLDYAETFAVIRGKTVTPICYWPVRERRLIKKGKIGEQLITGVRAVDSFFPIYKGSAVMVSGGFGTGKTSLLQHIAGYAQAKRRLMVLCGERGNEVADTLSKGNDLTLVVNTSNMPVAAREISVYTGMTIAEYFVSAGEDVIMTVDSLSRWAEAVREAGEAREEMPVEEGYPASVIDQLEEIIAFPGLFSKGSITMVLATSPPSGDFEELITRSAAAMVDTALFLNREQAFSRHYPAIDFARSFSKHAGQRAEKLRALVHRGMELERLVRITGEESLSQKSRSLLQLYQRFRLEYLDQNFFLGDEFTPWEEQQKRLEVYENELSKLGV